MFSNKLSTVRASNASFSPPYLPVAVFVGGTSGVGQGFLEAFATHTKGNARIIIVGRNRTAAELILSKIPNYDAERHEFVSCDATLMRNVHETAAKEILQRVDKINYLVMSQGYLAFGNDREDTVEGIPRRFALHYYGRWRFIKDLLPALLKAKEKGEDAKVCSVLVAGRGKAIDVEDLGLKKTFSFSKAYPTEVAYNDLMMEELATRYPTISWIHSFPGTVVRTPIMNASGSAVMKALSPVVFALTYPISISSSECGEYQLYGMLHTAREPGAYRIGSRGENLGKMGYVGTEEERRKLWEHSEEVTKVG